MILMCAVCFRGGEPLMRDSLNAGIFVLLGVTLTVLACVAVFFVQLSRRADAMGRLKPAPTYESGGVRHGTYVGAGFSRPIAGVSDD